MPPWQVYMELRFPRFSIKRQILRNITKMKQIFLEIFVFTAVWMHTDIVINWPVTQIASPF
jgi:hypothetical protein